MSEKTPSPGTQEKLLRFAIYMPLISLGLCLITRNNGGWTWLLLWPAFSCLLVGLAYALRDPRIFGKRADGSIAWWALLLLLPYLLASWLLWHIVHLAHRIHSTEPRASQISPNLWLSRRLTKKAELPAGVTCIVDLTCEFPAARPLIRDIPLYLCLPTLDYGVPRPDQVHALIEKLRTLEGGILIHCAQGHGRSAFLAAALLIANHTAKDPSDALRILKLTRPNVRLSRAQQLALSAIHIPTNPRDS